MEKYGVEQSVNDTKGTDASAQRGSSDTKSAATTRECRACGALLRSREVTGVLLCPKCGTRPYEE